MPDGPGALITDIATESPAFNLDVMMTLAAVARETSRVGLVATGSTTFNEPFNLARQFKALDVMSHGRAGWNAITSSGEEVVQTMVHEYLPAKIVMAVHMKLFN